MSTRRRLARLLQRRIPRRALTLPVVVVGGLLSALLAPITVPIAALLDRGRPWQRVRLVALVTGSLVIEVGGIVVATVTWIATGFGLFNNRRWVWHVHRPFMGWYASALLAWIARVLGTAVKWRDEPGDLRGPVVVLARHTSFFDAVIPAVLLSEFFLVNLFGAALAWCGNPVLPLDQLLGNVVTFSDLMILGMAFPNIFGAVLLSGKVKKALDDYMGKLRAGEFAQPGS